MKISNLLLCRYLWFKTSFWIHTKWFKGNMCYQMLKCLLFRGLHWFYRAFIFCYFSTVFITVNLKAFLPFVFFQLPKLNIKTCRVVPEPLRPAGLTTLLQISADSCVYCVLYTSTINPSGGFLLSPCEGCLHCLSVPSLLVGNCFSQCGEWSSSQQQHCACSIVQVGRDL